MNSVARARFARVSRGTRGYVLALVFGLIASSIWASSLVVIKIGLQFGGPITSAGFRFVIAFLILLPFLRGRLQGLRGPTAGRNWLLLIVAGLLGYTVMQWCAYAAVGLVPATTAAFLMSFSPFFVVLFGAIGLRELPGVFQWCGFLLAGMGIYVFFSLPLGFDSPLGVVLGVSAALSLAIFNVFLRHFTRQRQLGTTTLTAIPIAVGGVTLLIIGLVAEGAPVLTWQFVAIATWLAAISSVLAYALWNRALIRLRAYELNILWALVPVDTALIDWAVRGTPLELHQLAGMLALVTGALLVQYRGGLRQPRAFWRRRVSEAAAPSVNVP